MSEKSSSEPFWKGPCVDGITVSLLVRFLSCPERFRLYAIKGLQPKHVPFYPLQFGSMWHVCEEFSPNYLPKLIEYTQEQQARFPFGKVLLNTWMSVCRTLFDVYLDYYPNYRVSLYREQVFRVPYQLPCGRTVYLRGKIDGIDRLPNGNYCLFETKTKTYLPSKDYLQRQLSYDLQTLFYLNAISCDPTLEFDKSNLDTIVYNVIKRPVIQTPSYEDTQYASKLEAQVKEHPEKYFHRYSLEFDPQQIQVFRERTLDPILTWLCDWYDWVTSVDEKQIYRNPNGLHFMFPYGVPNLLEYDSLAAYDLYLERGEDRTLEPVTSLFSELNEPIPTA